MKGVDLSHKKALITGASGTIGSAIATAFYDHGASVIVSGTRETALIDLTKDWDPTRAMVAPANLKDKESMAQCVDRIKKTLDSIDIFINNAGIAHDNLFVRMTDEEWEEVQTVNLNAAFFLIRKFLYGMMKQRWGRVISVTSVVGHTGNAGQANYCATKAALTAMSKSLAAEVASRNITVNCIAPGYIASPMTQALSSEQEQRIRSRIPAGRIGSGEDVAYAALYLASEQASYITGQTLHVNGGLAMI